MKHSQLYALSKRYSPPTVNLQQGKILDDHGIETYAKLTIDHEMPENVSRDELNYYPHVYAFLKAEDLLFYFYPIFIAFEIDRNLECIDSFMFSLDRNLPQLIRQITLEEQEILTDYLKTLLEIDGNEYIHWQTMENVLTLVMK